MPPPNRPRSTTRRRPQHRRARHRSQRLRVVAGVAGLVVIVLGIIAFALGGISPKNSPAPSTTTAVPPSVPSLPETLHSVTSLAPATSRARSTTTVATTTTVPDTEPPSQVVVEVLNGTGQPGAAGSVADALEAAGFQVSGTTDATSFGYATTVVAYPPGLDVAATTLAAHLRGQVKLERDSAVPTGEIYLTVGSSYEGVSS